MITRSLVCCFILAVASAQSPERYDILISGGRVLDGTGNPWFYADVGIRGGRVAAVGRLGPAASSRVIDARGKIVVPGFIDLHSHADGEDDGDLRHADARRRAAPNLVSQGITTIAVNSDGGSPLSIADQKAELERLRMGPNAILLVGHNTVRRQVLGEDFRRAARPEEIDRMRAAVRRGMEAGAGGLSAGLEYSPGIWSTTDEVAALVAELAPFGGVFIQHERSSGAAPMWWKPSRDPAGPPTVLDSIRETIRIAEQTGVPTVATHLKTRGVGFWGVSGAVIRMIESARARGVEIWGDQYPYNTSGSDGSVVLVPDWATGSGGGAAILSPAEALRRALAVPATAERVRRDVAHEIDFRGGADNIVVFEYPDPAFIGKSIAQLAAARRVPPVEMALALQLEGYPDRRGGARLRSFSFDEADVEAFAARPWVATASDAGITLPEGGPAVHARYYGTFPRKIRRYALERGIISVEHAVRSATSLPAQILGLQDRGLIREGTHADLVVLDLERLQDKATFTEPHQHAEGVDYVLIAGRFVVDGGRLTGELPGRVLTPRRSER